jgi:hypothetical protein
MAKDALGHGSDTRGFRLVKTHVVGPHSAKIYKPPGDDELVVKTYRNGAYQSKNDYFTNDMADANGTALSQLNRWASQDGGRPVGAGQAASELASGPKSAPIPTHDSMGTPRPSDNIQNAGAKRGYNEYGSRHGYNPDAVNSAIAAQNRSGRGKIGGREASAIHRLLKGR